MFQELQNSPLLPEITLDISAKPSAALTPQKRICAILMGFPSHLSSEKFWSFPLILQKQMEGLPSQLSSVMFMFLYEEGFVNVPVQTEELDRVSVTSLPRAATRVGSLNPAQSWLWVCAALA